MLQNNLPDTDPDSDGPNPWLTVAVLLAIIAAVLLGILFVKYLINQL